MILGKELRTLLPVDVPLPICKEIALYAMTQWRLDMRDQAQRVFDQEIDDAYKTLALQFHKRATNSSVKGYRDTIVEIDTETPAQR